MHHKTMTKIQILVRKMRTLSLKPCASEGSTERPQTIASGWEKHQSKHSTRKTFKSLFCLQENRNLG